MRQLQRQAARLAHQNGCITTAIGRRGTGSPQKRALVVNFWSLLVRMLVATDTVSCTPLSSPSLSTATRASARSCTASILLYGLSAYMSSQSRCRFHCRRLLTRSPFVVNDFELCTLFCRVVKVVVPDVVLRRWRRLPLCVLVLALAVTLGLRGVVGRL